jgi:RsiW-degrading membrane proteinase PrsW (M82 family)
MASKQKLTKQKISAKDREDNRKFLIVLAVATLVLMLLMYFIYVM